MPFNSVLYLLMFLPISAIIYYLVPQKGRKIYLLVISYLFYIMVDQRLSKSFEALGLLIGASIVNYILIILMQRIPDTDIASNKKHPSDAGKISDSTRRSILFGIGILYNAFSLFGLRSFLLPFGLIPLGLSFYMFRCFSILGDVYLKKVKNITSYLDVALYIAFFPQVGMGPITQFNAFNKQLNTPKEFELNRIVAGMKRVVIGSFKKIVIADGLATFVGTCFDYPADQRTIFLAWMGGLCFILQEYNDFSGYSDVAIGTGMIFGYSCEENFNYPFASRSISEFWRRWHISLGAWLKTYIYLPLVIKFIKIKNPLTGKKLSPLAGDMLSCLLHGLSAAHGMAEARNISCGACTFLYFWQ
jgi:alginate O-acetyltransferase complex protein AlgI